MHVWGKGLPLPLKFLLEKAVMETTSAHGSIVLLNITMPCEEVKDQKTIIIHRTNLPYGQSDAIAIVLCSWHHPYIISIQTWCRDADNAETFLSLATKVNAENQLV